jgi:hypothetical protein
MIETTINLLDPAGFAVWQATPQSPYMFACRIVSIAAASPRRRVACPIHKVLRVGEASPSARAHMRT